MSRVVHSASGKPDTIDATDSPQLQQPEEVGNGGAGQHTALNLVSEDEAGRTMKKRKTEHLVHSESSVGNVPTQPTQVAPPQDMALEGPMDCDVGGQELIGGPPEGVVEDSPGPSRPSRQQKEKGEKRQRKAKGRGAEKTRAEVLSQDIIPGPKLEQSYKGTSNEVLAGHGLVQFLESEVQLQYGCGTVADQEKYTSLLKLAAAKIDRVPVAAINNRPPTALTTRPFLLDRRAQLVEHFNFDNLATCIVVVEDDPTEEAQGWAPVGARERGLEARRAWESYNLDKLLDGLLRGTSRTPLLCAFTLTGNHSTDALVHLVEMGSVPVSRAVRCCYVYFHGQLSDEHFQLLARFENEACVAHAQMTADYNLFSDPQYLCPFIRGHWADLGYPKRDSEAFQRRMNAVLEFRAESETQKAALKDLERNKAELFLQHTAALNKLHKERSYYSEEEYAAKKRKVGALQAELQSATMLLMDSLLVLCN